MLTAITALLLLGGCTGRDDVGETEEGRLVIGRTEVTETDERGIDPGGRLLSISGFSGTIALQGTTEPLARLAFEKTARGDDEEDARNLLHNVSVEETGGDDAYRYIVRTHDANRTGVNIEGTIPRGTPLRLEMDNATILLSGLDAPVTVRSGNGNVQVGGAGASLDVEVRNGNIEVGMQALPPGARVHLQTSNGNLAFTLPPTSGARVTAQTKAGDVRVEGLDFESRRLVPSAAGAEFTGQLGRGNATVELSTENGNITLRGGTVSSLPALTPPPAAPDTTRPAALRDTTSVR